MTKAAKRALKQVGVPTVALHASGQFYARIGYRRSKSGVRQRAVFYLGRDEREAVAKAASLKHEWREIKRRDGGNAVWPFATKADVATAKDIAPDTRLSRQQIDAAIARHHAEMSDNALELGVGMEGDGVVEQTPTLRLEQVRALYLEYRKAKVGILGGEGLKQSTYMEDARNLTLAMRDVDAKLIVNALGYRELDGWKTAVFRRVGGDKGISRRTAVNYLRAVKGMLDWSHYRAEIPYRHPDGVENVFSFKNVTTVNIAAYDAKQLKTMLGKATDRERLYVYLALNCGHYQSDIGSLRLAEIVEYEGKRVIVRRREKTSHQNDFESLHVLWDETWSLLKSEMAKTNPYGRALLNDADKPLYKYDENGKYDGVTQSWQELRVRSGVRLAFKQLRKIGVSAMERIGGQQARRLYKAGTVDSGDKVYVREAWENLAPHLSAWGEQLRRDGVLK